MKSDSRPRRLPASILLRRAIFFSLVATLLGTLLWRGALWMRGASQRPTFAATNLRTRPTCDVLVLGGTPSGIAAALAASRGGAHVVLLESTARLGGDITHAMLNMLDVPLSGRDAASGAIGGGIFGEFYRQLGVAFDIELAERVFEEALAAHPNIRVIKNARVGRVILEEKRLVGVVLRVEHGREELIVAPAIVDASNDAEFAARAGAGYSLGRQNAHPDQKMQAAGLLFSVRGVDWDAVRAYVKGQKAVSLADLKKFKHGAAGSIDVRLEKRGALLRLGGTEGNYAWERGDIIKDYVPRGPNIVILSLNLGRQPRDGSVVLNTLNIVGVNGLDAASRAQARAEATREIPHLIEYLRDAMPGFGAAKLHQIASQLYIRETRHIHGKATLEVEDVRSDRAFPDRIALCSYPLDLHPYARDDKNKFGPERYEYTLPLGALVPRRIDGVFVASRSLSATYSAAGSARVIPITMAAGQAAGQAAVLCAREGVSPHQLVDSPSRIAQLQDDLRKAQVNIGDDLVKTP